MTSTKRMSAYDVDTDTNPKSVQRTVGPVPTATVLTEQKLASVEEGVSNTRALFELPPSIVETMVHKNKKATVLFAIDLSPSMTDSIPLLRDAIKKLPAMLKPTGDESVITSVDVAVGVFSDDTRMLEAGADCGPHGYVPFGQLTDVAASNIALTLEAYGSGTNTSGMVELAMQELRLNRLENGGAADQLQHLVILTDGKPTVGVRDNVDLENIVKYRVDPKKEGHAVVVHVLCLGMHINRDVSKALVKSTGGIVGHAKNADELSDELGRIVGPIMGSSAAFTLEVVDAKVQAPDERRYIRNGMLTANNHQTLFAISAAPKVNAGMHLAATVRMAHSGMPLSSILLNFLPDADYKASAPAVPPPKIKALLDEEALQKEEEEKIREALARNDFIEASEISSTYTQTYTDRGLHAAATRSGYRTDRLVQMSNNPTELPQLGEDGASMTMDAMASQSQFV